ncbi:MAG: hypothetical protein CTY12_06325 [Methylotenera sp.]|nr:MAG: hypothetical protein CTY12_06325 [Methylotenera sp.]
MQVTTTVDNVTWTEQPLPSLLTPNQPFKVVGFGYNNQALVIGNNIYDSVESSNLLNNQTLLWRSTNGVMWDQTTVADNPVINVSTGNGLFVSVNNASAQQILSSSIISTPNDWKPISTSTDGFNWFEKTIPLAVEDQFSQVLYADSEFKAIGNVSILRSEDGDTWTQQLVSFPQSHFSSVEYGITDKLSNKKLNNPTFSDVVYGSGKYLYTAISPQRIGNCTANVLNVMITSGSGNVTNNTAYGCEWIVNTTGFGNMTVQITNPSYTSVVLKITLKSVDLIDHINGVKVNAADLGPFDPVYKEVISGTNERVYFYNFPSSSLLNLNVNVLNQGFTMSSIALPEIRIESYPNYIYNVVAHSTTDFNTFNTSSPLIFDVRPVTDKLMALGYAFDRWVLWYNTFITEDNCTYDYVVYSTDGITWVRANSFTIARTNFTDPGSAELYPSYLTNDSIDKKYQIGYSGGAIMTSSNGTDWVGWTPSPIVII